VAGRRHGALVLSPPQVLVEADGSRRLPFKAPADHEPVLPDTAAVVLAVAGIDALGAPLSEDFVCRAHVVASLTGTQLGAEVQASTVAQVQRLSVSLRLLSTCACTAATQSPPPGWLLPQVLGSRAVWGVAPSVRMFAAAINKVDGDGDGDGDGDAVRSRLGAAESIAEMALGMGGGLDLALVTGAREGVGRGSVLRVLRGSGHAAEPHEGARPAPDIPS
jgi:hypothetical protein